MTDEADDATTVVNRIFGPVFHSDDRFFLLDDQRMRVFSSGEKPPVGLEEISLDEAWEKFYKRLDRPPPPVLSNRWVE